MELVKIGGSSNFNIGEIGPICLVIPPSIFLLDERVFMSLGILRVAAVLERAGLKVEVLDLSGVKNFLEVISDYISSRDYVKIFALTATTPQLPAVSNIVRTIRDSSRDKVRIILGGPHITLVNAAYKREVSKNYHGRATKAMNQAREMFDVLVSGDGEESIFHAIVSNPPKLIDADDKNSSLFLNNEKLNELPFPARHLVDINSYNYTIEGVSALSLIAQLGCPFGCGFCGGRESPMLRKIRTRTSENIVAEMVHLYKTTGRRGFMMYDDELNVNKQIVELMRLIAKTQKELGVEWRLRGFIKAELFTDEQAEVMYDAGFRWILTGFESGSPAILKAINKGATREDNTKCIEIAKRNGLKVKALMSIGHPGESKESVMDTKDWLIQVKPDDFDVSIITCYPGTPYYDQAIEHKNGGNVWVYTYQKTGKKLYQLEIDYTKTADYYKGDPDGGYNAYVFTDDLSPRDLVDLRNYIEKIVRENLNIPFNHSAPAMMYEHSMGQNNRFPENILRVSK